MNKFVKYGTIVGFILILTGIGVSAAAFALGANFYELERVFADRVEQQYRDRYGSHYYNPYENAYQGTFVAMDETVAPEESGADSGSAYFEGGWHAEYPELSELDIEQRGGTVQIQMSDTAENLMIDCDNGDIDRMTYEEGGFEKKLTVRVRENDNCMITIPYGWNLPELEAEVSGGTLEGIDICVADAKFHARGGVITVTQSQGTTLELESSANGTVNWAGSGELISMVDVECKGGEVNITLPAGYGLDAYNFKAECEGGTIRMPDLTIEGVDKKRIPGEGATAVMDIEAKSGGTVSVND